ncbi:capsular biosynthesis protein [Paraburkholderia phymatum]|uniref:Capsule polysaccharide biosynthesis protein n=1 Tax=Paraburkholderia phymatum (strain DSM 17167 / CIP 108236 / LMG 21445 / STM815) TaxID=391038 RepID=B2JS51_PARP8|nr:capsular polysaccharide biosynthesis protein [Paraburkholderia phymatum]ACC72428.1 Capsule polysaccharide biosynthesis protein [Paraburkholderia phymatum STM815]
MTIAVVIDSLERFYFVRRLVKALDKEGDFVFMTSEPLAHLFFRLEGRHSIYLRRAKNNSSGLAYGSSLFDRSIEVMNGTIDAHVARQDWMATFTAALDVFNRLAITVCVMWNGQQLICRAVGHACSTYGVRVRFLELSNLPEKLFADDEGVNALSTVARDPSIIDRFSMPDLSEHERWLRRYEEYKRRPLPQSQTSIRRKGLSLLNYAVKVLTQGVGRKRLDRSRASNGVRLPAIASSIGEDALISRRYVFLPLQVSGDTQIKLHSDVDNLEAIRIALELAESEGMDLIVKLHPAENDRAVIDEIARLQTIHQFQIVTTAAVDLIKHAAMVVTINSTVGLEAMLYGKKVVALGRCLYREFDRDRLMKYIHGFLVDGIDYFGNGPIDPRAARRVFSNDGRI